MSNDQNKAGINPISNKQLRTAPLPLIMPSARRTTVAAASKSGKSTKAAQLGKEHTDAVPDEPQADMDLLTEAEAAARAQESADAAMSVRRGETDEEEEERTEELSGNARQDDERLLLAQASSASSGSKTGAGQTSADAPVSVGEELLRQAAPLPGAREKSGADWMESWFGKDWKLPLAIGGGALALLGLAAAGGGGGGSSGNTNAQPDAGSTPAVPSNTWTLTVTPAAGIFIAGASVRAIAQKWMGGEWQDIGSATTVDRNGRMSIKVEKSQVTAQDIVRVVIRDTGSSADQRDEVAGPMTLGSTDMVAIIGNLTSDQQLTVNPLTTLAAGRIGQDLSAANIDAIHAAVAKAFGINAGDLAHLLPTFLGGGGNPILTPDSQNYGLALGLLAGMAQAQRDAGVASEDALGAALKLLASAFEEQAGKWVLNLEKIRSATVRGADGQTLMPVGLDEAALRLYNAASADGAGANGAQVPYINIDTGIEKPVAGKTPAPGVAASISAVSFSDGLTLRVNTADSVKAGDSLRIEFIRLGADGKPVENAKIFTYDYVLTQKDVDAVRNSINDASNKGGGFFKLTVPTHIDDPARAGNRGIRPAKPSSSDATIFLLPVTRRDGEQDSYYDPVPNVDATFQLRATGSALGYVAAGAKISLNMAQIALESAPPGGTFNGMADSGASTLRIALALPYKISWSGNAPKLTVTLAGSNFDADCETSDNTNGGDVLHFILRLGAAGDASTKGLDGDIRIPANALKFHADSYVYTDGGNLLFTPDGAGNWSDRDGHAFPGNDIAKAIGVDTQLATTYKVDTKPPADPKLEMVEHPVFVNGFRPALDASGGGVPVPEKLNAIVSSNPDDGFSVWTSKITQKFSVVTGQSFDKVNDKGAIVRLMVSFTGTGGPGENFAEAILAEERLDEKGEATFTESSYKAEVVASLNRFAQKANFGDGVPLKLSAYVLDKAGNKSQQQDLTFSGNSDKAKFVLDVQAPRAPDNVQLDTGSDTGRDTGSTTTDNITALSQPVVIVKGGTIGSVISLWSDAAHEKLLGRGQVEALSNIAGENGARITLSSPLDPGDNTLYAGLIDQAGNKSVGDKSLQVTYLKPIDGNTPLKLNISSTAPAVSKGFYKVGDVIEVSVDFGRDVFLKQGKVSSQLAVQLVPAKADGAPPPTPDEIAKALYVGGLGSSILKFKYTVAQDIDKGALNSVFTAAALLNADQVLEDVAGSTVIGKFIAVDGQSLKIDTIAPPAPTVVLPAGLPMTDGQPTFSLDAATNRGFTVKAEAGSTISIKVKNINNLTGSGYTKTVIATGADQIITPTAAELASITGSVFQVTATATDAAGNISAQSVAQTFVLDVRAPVASAVSSSLTSVTNQPFDFKVSFDEALRAAPNKDDFTVTNGSITDVVPIPGTNSFTVKVTPAPGVDAGVVSLSIKPGAAMPLADIAGNPVAAGNTLATQAIDTRAPVISARPEASGPVKNGPINFIVEFNEALDAAKGGVLLKENFTATNGRVTSVTALDASTKRYKVTVDPQLPASSTRSDTPVSLNYVQVFSPGFAVASDAVGNRTQNQSSIATQIVDIIAPTITSSALSATVKTNNPVKAGYYHAGDTLTVTVAFSEAVVVTGTPTLDLDLGGATPRQASFSGQSEDKRSVIFTYVVAAGDNTATGVALPADGIKLPVGSSITDVAGNAATLTQAAKPGDANVKIDNVAPGIEAASIEPAVATANGLYKTGAVLTAAVRFSEEVEISIAGGKPTLSLSIGGQERTATLRDRTAADDKKLLYFTYTVTAGDNEPSGVVIPANALKLAGAAITDVSGNNAVLAYSGSAPNASIKVDTNAPVVSSVVVSAAADAGGTGGLYRAGDKLTATVTFNESIQVDTSAGSPTLKLQVGAATYDATYDSQSGNAVKFSYTLSPADAAPAGVAVAAGGLELHNAVITDLAGNAANLAYTAVPPNPAVKVDNAAPTITGFSAATDSTLIIGSSLMLKAKVSEALRPGATMKVSLNNGGEATLTLDQSDPTQFVGQYTVQEAQNTSNLKISSFTSTAKDLAGNALSLGVPAGSANLGAVNPIAVDATRPSKLTLFQLDAASDAGFSDKDGLTNVTLPSFRLEGLQTGALVTISATWNGSVRTLLTFTATATSQKVTLSGTALADGTYTAVSASQFSPTGNPSEGLLLGNTSKSGEMTISTVAPTGVAASLVFDYIQDTLAENELGRYLTQADGAKTPGSQTARDYSTSIQTPRFNFLNGQDREIAVLFRDVNGNNAFDAGDIVLGRKQIGSATAVSSYRVTTVGDVKNNGHFVDVAPENGLANGLYTDIKLVLQSEAGSYGAASAAAVGNLRVINNAPLKALTDVKATQAIPSDPTSAKTLQLSVGDGQQGALLTITADLIALNGSTTSGVTIGSGILTASKTVEIDTSGLNGRYENFKALQRYAGKTSAPVEVKSQSGGALVATWDHVAPTVAVALKPGITAAHPGQPVDVEFNFSEAVTDFTADDVIVKGGALSGLTAPAGSGLKWTATFTPSAAGNVAPSIQVKGGSYTDLAGNQGAGSDVFHVTTNTPGTVALSGGSAGGGVPQVGDTLTASVTDPDTVVAPSVSYVWRVDGTVVAGETASTYVVKQADRGKTITADVHYTDSAGVSENVSSAPTSAVLAQNSPGTFAVKINGRWLSAAEMADPADRILHWNDKVEVLVSDADGIDTTRPQNYAWGDRQTHVPVGFDNLHALNFEVLPSIAKDSRVTLLATYTDLAGKTATIETPVFKIRPDQRPGSVTIAAYDSTNPDNPHHPVAEGAALQVGNWVHASVEDQNGVDLNNVIYTWRVDGELRPQENYNEYQITQADYGKQVTVDVSYMDNDGHQEAVHSNALVIVPNPGNHPATGDVTLSGSGTVGTVVMAAPSNIQDQDVVPQGVTYTFTWTATDKTTNAVTDISSAHFQGGDSSKLVVTSDLAGKDIRAVAHFTDGVGNAESVAGSTPVAAALPASFAVQGPITFTGFADPAPAAKLLQVASGSNLYMLDVDGNGTIDRADATTYISNLNGQSSLTLLTGGGQGSARLLDKDSAAWATNPVLGTATGAKGANGTSSATDVLANDFWTSTPGGIDGINSHFVWTTDPRGPYAKADNSPAADANRLHYNVFQVTVNPGTVLPG